MDPEFKAVQDGVCAGLTAHWLKDHGNFQSSIDGTMSVGIHGQYLYTQKHRCNLNDFLEDVGLQEAVKLPRAGYDTLPDWIDFWLRHDARNPARAYILTYVSSNSPDKVSGKHAMAATKALGGPMKFFDANAGSYEIIDGNEEGFFTALTAGYQNAGYSLTGTEIVAVKNKTNRFTRLFKRS